MTQEHGDRLTAVDASFLAQEGPTAHMHVGAVMIFEGPPPAYEDLADHVRARLHLVPRFRQKLAFPPLETGRPLWVDDPTLQPRVPRARHGAAGAGLGGAAARARRARALAGARPLQAAVGDVARAGARGRAASRCSPRRTTRSSTASPASTSRRCCSTSSPARPPSSTRDAAVAPAAAAERARHGGARRARAASRCRSTPPRARPARRTRPRESLARDARGARGARRGRLGGPEPGARHAAQRRDRPAPAARLGAQRAAPTSSASRTPSAAPSTTSCSRSSPARCRSGCARAACAPRGSSCARSSRSRSARTRRAPASSATGIAAMRAPLPVYVEDPVARLRVVRQAMDGLKESKQARRRRGARRDAGARAADDLRAGVAAQLLHAPVQPARDERAGAAVPALRARAPAARTCSRSRSCPSDHALAVAIMSYDGGMDFGLLGDYDAMPDLEQLGRDVRRRACRSCSTRPRRRPASRRRTGTAAQ